MPSRSEVWKFAAEFYRDQLRSRFDSVLIGGKNVTDRYGLTNKTLYDYYVGFSPAEISLFDILKSELKITLDEARRNNGWGLLTFGKYEPPKVYNYFQDRLIFAYPRGNEIEFFSGRKTDSEKDLYETKFLHIPLDPSYNLSDKPLFLQPAMNGPTILVEGPAHALILRQLGFAGIAIGGAVPNETQMRSLKRIVNLYWWPDVDQLAKREGHFKEDENRGRKFVAGLSQYDQLHRIYPHLRDMNAKLIRYDEPFASENKTGDLNDWFFIEKESDTEQEILRKIDQAIDHYQVLVLSVDPSLSGVERGNRLDDVIKELQWIPDIVNEEVIAKLRNHLGLSAEMVKGIKRRIWALRKNKESQQVLPKADDFSEVPDYQEIKPGMDFINGKLLYTVHKPVKVTAGGQTSIEHFPYIVTSAREIYEFNGEQLYDRKLRIDKDTQIQSSDIKNLWSLNPNDEWSLPRFLKNSDDRPDTKQLFDDIKNYLEKYIYVENPYTLDFLTCFTVCTYCVQLFDAMGLLSLTGTRSVGKTRVMEVLHEIVWDPVMSAQSTESPLFRNVDSRSCTIFMDEAEFLNMQFFKNGQPNDKAAMFNAAYRKSGRTTRSQGETHRPTNFRTYTSYVLGSQKEPNPTLASRAITFQMVKRPSHLFHEHWFPKRIEAFSKSIRNRLHYWVLASAGMIYESYNDILSAAFDELMSNWNLRDRELECWTPYLCVARTADWLTSGEKWTPTKENSLPNPNTLFGKVLFAAQYLTEFKNAQLADQDMTPKLLIAMRQMLHYGYVRDHKPPPNVILPELPQDYLDEHKGSRWGWYSSAEITNYMWKLQGLGEMKWPKTTGVNSLKPQLAKCNVCIYPEDEKRWELGGHRKQFIRIFQYRIDRQCKTYNVPEGEIEFMAGEQMTGDEQGQLPEQPTALDEEDYQ